MDQAEDELFIVDAHHGGLIDFNATAARRLGYEGRQMSGMRLGEILGLQLPYTVMNVLQALPQSGQRTSLSGSQRRRDGTEYPVEAAFSYYQHEDQDYVVAVVRDVTDRKKAERETTRLHRQLEQSQRAEALAALAGGIAHDFNNILTSISGFARLAYDDSPAEASQRESLNEVLQGCDRAAKLVSQIVAFGRQEQQAHQSVDLAVLIEEDRRLLAASLPATVDLRIEAQPSVGFVFADPSMLHQIVMNLCTNAHQAMGPKGGQLDVVVQGVKLPNGTRASEAPDLPPGSYVALKVSDTGPGVDPRHREKIFEPYFTTKVGGQGTGLGLSVVHGITKSLGGDIVLESGHGAGATFVVYLPTTQRSPQSTQPDTGLPRGEESVLFVDDEEVITRLGRQLLERLGYRVFAYSDPKLALKDFVSRPQEFDLALVDVTMPRMTGLELLGKLKRCRPDLPVLLVTGYSDLVDRDKARVLGAEDLLAKPLSLEILAQTIRSALDTRKSA